ncbi:hypothetical protein AURDEDRAFT_163460 [Auricularia subglabra TFB-10046 SS5]|nr:hypothetical protein AURDEDRAFT_163460 [Auricularia subglabra TFB-10046 SS5]
MALDDAAGAAWLARPPCRPHHPPSPPQIGALGVASPAPAPSPADPISLYEINWRHLCTTNARDVSKDIFYSATHASAPTRFTQLCLQVSSPGAVRRVDSDVSFCETIDLLGVPGIVEHITQLTIDDRHVRPLIQACTIMPALSDLCIVLITWHDLARLTDEEVALSDENLVWKGCKCLGGPFSDGYHEGGPPDADCPAAWPSLKTLELRATCAESTVAPRVLRGLACALIPAPDRPVALVLSNGLALSDDAQGPEIALLFSEIRRTDSEFCAALASTLPVELLSLVLSHLSLVQLLPASHVSKYWHTVARRHPTFWRDVTLAAASPSAIDFFHARLEAGSTRTVTIRLYVPPPQFSPDVRAVVFSTVTRNLDRIDGLHIDLPISADEEMYSALHHPAPRLESLDISVIDDTETSDALPVDLFACEAPRLRYVRLANTRLCPEKVPKVFAPIKELNYCFAEALPFPTTVFMHCPALETLIMYGKYCVIELAEDAPCTLPGENLRYLGMTVFEGSSDLIHRVPCASTPWISIALSDKQSAQALLGHLRGPIELRLALETDTERLFLHYQSVETGLRRTFLASPAQIDTAYLPPAYVADDVVSRVETLHAMSACAGLLPAYHELAACTRVAFSLAGGEPLKPPSCPLRVPKLERVELAGSTPQSLDARDLVAFLDGAFAPGSAPVHLALLGITLVGDLDAIPRDRYVIAPVVAT